MKWPVPTRMRTFLGFLDTFVVCCSVIVMAQISHADPLDPLHHSLPAKIEGWKALLEEDHIYDRETIFDYIDGAGTRFSLGNSSPDRIELIKLGWKKDGFIKT